MKHRAAHPQLEIEEDMRAHRREWVMQRVGWTVIGVFLLAGVAGVLGPGPLSNRTATDGAVRVEYCRFERHHRNAELVVHAPASAAREGKLRLWLPAAYVNTVEIRTIRPWPAKQEVQGNRVVYEFLVAEGSAEVTVIFGIEPMGYGRVEGRAGVEGSGEAAFEQFVYP